MSYPIEFPGNPRLRAQLERALASGRLPGAYLFEGAPGAGQEQAAVALAAGFITGAESPDDPDARRVRRYSHPDLHYLLPVIKPSSRSWGEMKDDELLGLFREQQAKKIEDPYYLPNYSGKPHLAIEALRQAIRVLNTKAFEGKGKALILRDADLVQPNAQDVLLKTLEEPPAHSLIVLISYRPEALRPTILSRCLRMPFDPIDPALIRELLVSRGLCAERADFLATLADGDIERAVQFASAEGDEENTLLAERERAFDLLDTCEFASELDMLDAIQAFCRSKGGGNPVQLRAGFLALAISWYRELLRQPQSPGELRVHVDQAARLKRYAELREEALLFRIRACEKARRQILGYTNAELTLLSLFFSLRASQGRASSRTR